MRKKTDGGSWIQEKSCRGRQRLNKGGKERGLRARKRGRGALERKSREGNRPTRGLVFGLLPDSSWEAVSPRRKQGRQPAPRGDRTESRDPGVRGILALHGRAAPLGGKMCTHTSVSTAALFLTARSAPSHLSSWVLQRNRPLGDPRAQTSREFSEGSGWRYRQGRRVWDPWGRPAGWKPPQESRLRSGGRILSFLGNLSFLL